MRILLVSRFPPLQGGVSSAAFWFVQAMLQRGHDINVVTDAGEPTMGRTSPPVDSDFSYPRPRSGRLTVRSVSHQEVAHYPGSTWAIRATQLFSVASQVADRTNPNVIVGWYLHPYAAIAVTVAVDRNVQSIVIHAGSDLALLDKGGTYAEGYKSILLRASRIITTPAAEAKLRGILGPDVDLDQVVPLLGYPLGKSFYSGTSVLPIRSYLRREPSLSQGFGVKPVLESMIAKLNNKEFPLPSTVLGVYGSVSRYKALSELLVGMASAAAANLDFSFLWVTGGNEDLLEEFVQFIYSSKPLRIRTWILPFVAPWQIPDLLRLCRAVFCLENNFPVPLHLTRIPHEVLACGPCLVMSEEAASKLPLRPSLVNGVNCLIVNDPSDQSQVTDVVMRIVSRPDYVRTVGVRGRLLYQSVVRFRAGDHPLNGVLDQIRACN